MVIMMLMMTMTIMIRMTMMIKPTLWGILWGILTEDSFHNNHSGEVWQWWSVDQSIWWSWWWVSSDERKIMMIKFILLEHFSQQLLRRGMDDDYEKVKLMIIMKNSLSVNFSYRAFLNCPAWPAERVGTELFLPQRVSSWPALMLTLERWASW